MANNIVCVLGVYLLSLLAETVNGGSYCYYYIDSYARYDGSYCTNGCCSYTSYNPCCSDYDNYRDSDYDFYYSSAVSGGAIAGIVIGCLVGMGVFITVCVVCVCNANRRSTAYGGQVVTNPGATVSYISTSNGTVAHVQPNGQPYGQPYTQPYTHPYGGQVNSDFAVGQTTPAYSKGNNSAPPPSYTSVVNDSEHQTTSNVQSPYPTQSDQTTAHYSDLTPHSDGSEHHYSTITESNTPSAPSAEYTY
ncbi:Hypothetical predicted protein [Mytilus galloprovincialis]|uniref:Cysteine and tyrosine-rich protein 1 n=1 Tax=Mytilus galloprovincialis TaxID=29158 RepID=A0A8B6DZ03_MYTGA|nr:Hypothetical predicted protein [Mytilus galloprovincialis]